MAMLRWAALAFLLSIGSVAACACFDDPTEPAISGDEAVRIVAEELCPENASEFEQRLQSHVDSGVWLVVVEGYHFDSSGKDDTVFYVDTDRETDEPFLHVGDNLPAQTFLAERPESCLPGSTAP